MRQQRDSACRRRLSARAGTALATVAAAAVLAAGPARAPAPARAAAQPRQPAGHRQSAWTDTSARADLIARLSGPVNGPDHGSFLTDLHDDRGNRMDSAKIIQSGPGAYLAVYATGTTIKLATSANLVSWHYTADLDTSATQPYLAEAGDHSFVLADEKYDTAGATSGPSHLFFLHYTSLAGLLAGRPGQSFTPPDTPGRGPRFLSRCNEGTPDISGLNADASVIGVGFHYDADCSRGLDREAYGTLTGFRSMRAAADQVRDNAAAAAGFPGKHGGRDFLRWHGFPFSIMEAQDSTDLGSYRNWRYLLYDPTAGRAYPVALPAAITAATHASCHGNPKVTALTGPAGEAVLAVTGYLFGGSAGCATAGAGELLYTVAAGGPAPAPTPRRAAVLLPGASPAHLAARSWHSCRTASLCQGIEEEMPVYCCSVSGNVSCLAGCLKRVLTRPEEARSGARATASRLPPAGGGVCSDPPVRISRAADRCHPGRDIDRDGAHRR